MTRITSQWRIIAVGSLIFTSWPSYALVAQQGQRTLEDMLWSAAGSGQIGLVQEFLAEGASIDAADARGWTALTNAVVLSGSVETVRLLLERGADPNVRDSENNTLLMWAVNRADRPGTVDIARLLLEKGVDPYAVNASGDRALGLAAYRAQVDMVRIILEDGADVDMKNFEGRTPLLLVAMRRTATVDELAREIEVVQLFLKYGADPNARDALGMTPLIWAAYKGYAGMVGPLLENGADPNARNNNGATALTIAASRGQETADPIDRIGYVETVRLLRSEPLQGANQAAAAAARLLNASENGDCRTVSVLLQAGVNPNPTLENGASALMLAADKGHITCVRALLEAGASVNLRDDVNMTALLYAAQHGRAAIIEALLAAGAAVNASNIEGATALGFLLQARADQQARTAAAKSLLARGGTLIANPTTAEEAWLNHNETGYLAFAVGSFSVAENHFTQAVKIAAQFGSRDLRLPTSLGNLAEVYVALGRESDAEPLLDRALSLEHQVLGQQHPRAAGTSVNLAGVYRARGEYSRAELLLRSALPVLEKAGNEYLEAVGSAQYNLAEVHRAQKRYREAEQFYNLSVATVGRMPPPAHPGVSLLGLGQLYTDQEKYGEAESVLKRALALFSAVDPAHPTVALTLSALGRLNTETDKYPEAERLFKEALVKMERAVGPTHPEVAAILDSYAVLLRKVGKDAEAVQLEVRAQTIRRTPRR